MTDTRDSCFGCGGHLRRNVYSGSLCPSCELRHQRGEITAFGDVVEQWTEVEGDPINPPKWGKAA